MNYYWPNMEKKLIGIVRQHTVLYDTSHPGYMKSKLKNNIWDGIARQLKLKNGEAAKLAWLKLRSCHREALRRQKKCLDSGCEKDVKQWRYQKRMEYLLPYMAIYRKRADDSDEEDNIISELTGAEHSYELQTPNSENYYETQNDDTNDEENGGSAENLTVTPSFEFQNLVFNVNKKIKEEVTDRSIQQSIANQETNEKLEDSQSLKDPLYHFFMSMYYTTQKLSPASQFYIKNQIFNVVSKAEANILHIPIAFPQTSEQPQSTAGEL